MVVVTHDQAEALSLGDRVAVLDGGRLLQHDTPAAVYDRPASIGVARFIGRPPMTILTPGQAAALGLDGTVGVRAEHVVQDAAGAPAVVELVERAGHEVLAHLRLAGDLLPARIDAAEGAAVRVRAARHRRFAP
jgi:ABC-type sugar transport system ATPase subunit